MNTSLLKTSLSLLALASASPLWAQDQSATAGDDYSITVIGDHLDASQTNASWSLIDEADIKRAQNGAASDLLERLPGVSTTRNGGLGSFTGVRIRGAEAEQTLVVIDGVRVGDPSSPGGGFDFGSLMLGTIDRIEVLRGSNSLPWGSQAIGGVVAISTTGAIPGEIDRASGQVQGEYGARDTVRFNGQLRHLKLGPTSFGLGGGYVRTDGISTAAIGTERDGYRQYSLNLTNQTQISNSLALSAFGLYSNSRVDLDGFGPPTYIFGDTAEFQRTREHYAGVTLKHTPGDNHGSPGFSQQLGFGLSDINRDNYDPAQGAAPSFGARGRNERLSYSVDWLPFGTGGEQQSEDVLRLRAGADREWSRSQTSDAFSKDIGRTITSSLWGMVVGKPTNTLSLTAGIRYDHHRQFGGATTFALDAGQVLSSNWSLRASYREGFKAPTLFQLSATASAYGNPALAPELARAFEIGTRFHGGNIWFVDIALFRRDSRNLIDFVSCPVGPNPQPAICATGNRPFGTYDNINRARAEGIEIEGSFRFSDTLRLGANASLLTVKDRTSGSALQGNRLARRPRQNANVDLTWSPGANLQGADLSLAARYAGASFDDRANLVRLDSYWLFDIRARYPVTPSVDLFGRIENLFNEHYQTVATYGTPGRSAYVGLRWGY